MQDSDLKRIKNFVRVCFEIEEALNISWTQKKVLLKVLDLWRYQSYAPRITEVAYSVSETSESSVYRHLKVLIKKRWLQVKIDEQDQRVKFVEPTPRLIKALALKV